MVFIRHSAVDKFQRILILLMPGARRSYRGTVRPEKPFINSYHLNETPLPYYNPLEDPYLRNFFALSRNKHQLDRHGLIY